MKDSSNAHKINNKNKQTKKQTKTKPVIRIILTVKSQEISFIKKQKTFKLFKKCKSGIR